MRETMEITFFKCCQLLCGIEISWTEMGAENEKWNGILQMQSFSHIGTILLLMDLFL